MKYSALGLIAGLLMTIAIVIGGFYGFLLALVLGIVGWAVGAYLDGTLDVAQFQRGRRG